MEEVGARLRWRALLIAVTIYVPWVRRPLSSNTPFRRPRSSKHAIPTFTLLKTHHTRRGPSQARSSRSSPRHYITFHCIALHYITLHCIALHCIALHCIALHCIT